MHEDKEEPYVLVLIANPKANPTDNSGGASDLEQWLVDIPSAEYGCWTNGIENNLLSKKEIKI